MSDSELKALWLLFPADTVQEILAAVQVRQTSVRQFMHDAVRELLDY